MCSSDKKTAYRCGVWPLFTQVCGCSHPVLILDLSWPQKQIKLFLLQNVLSKRCHKFLQCCLDFHSPSLLPHFIFNAVEFLIFFRVHSQMTEAFSIFFFFFFLSSNQLQPRRKLGRWAETSLPLLLVHTSTLKNAVNSVAEVFLEDNFCFS